MNISSLLTQYRESGIAGVIDHERFNLIAIDHHSTRIEGSTLTEVETQVLINEGRTPNGRPLEESLMVTDHHAALVFAIGEARAKRPLSTDLIRELNALVMRHTGKIYQNVFGNTDSSTGAYRKGNVSAGSSYFPNFDKVERLTSTGLVRFAVGHGVQRAQGRLYTGTDRRTGSRRHRSVSELYVRGVRNAVDRRTFEIQTAD